MNTETAVKAEHISFPSIEQYRNTIKLVRERAAFDGLPLPTLTFRGSVKLHGTNAAVGFTGSGEMYAQSRSQIIQPGKTDNAGFAAWLQENQDVLPKLVSSVIYGEWCGGSIQKGVALNGIPKMFVPFAVLSGGRWWSPEEMRTFFFHSGLRCIYDFPSWSIDIDFSKPEEYQNYLGELTQQVEDECPVGKMFGSLGTGEGIVWWPNYRSDFNTENLAFKVKGAKHSETHVKTLTAVDVEKIASVRLLVDSIVTTHRLEKKLEGIGLDVRNTGLFLKTVTSDVAREERDSIEASGLPLTEVMRAVSLRAKDFFMQTIKQDGSL